MLSTSQKRAPIFEKVRICIERGMYSVYVKEINLKKNEKGVLFLPASWTVPNL